MKKWITWLLALTMTLTMVACGTTSDTPSDTANNQEQEETTTPDTTTEGESTEDSGTTEEKYIIGMSQCNLGEPWRVAMNNQIAAAAEEYPMFEVIYSDAAQDNSKQIADIQNFIQMGVDLIIASPNEAKPLTNVIKEAYDAGIPVILLDRKIEGDTYTQFIGADNVQIGYECGKYVAETLLPDGGKVCEIKGLEGTSGGVDRDNGFREGIKVNPKVEIIDANNADWLREKAITVAEEMLQRHDDIDLFFALNDPMAEGAFIAAQNAGREEDILFVGVDGLPTPDGGIKSVIDGRLSMSMVYPTGGREAIESAYQLLVEGKELEKTITLESEVITPETAPDLLVKYGGE
ncbi:substrate-binding domain-containing protein [Candidatus Avoscillospira sp. LCP25S3_F1]|uniref:substrate-binding domain-containing protein n=1 Tax=Candidatus Avoscillospira sp. LCP25S3_F1 TaxID=3438825 RepID=UPI003F8E98CD